MGYHVEYLVDLPPPQARNWLSGLPGWWAEHQSSDELPYGEFAWGGRGVFAELGDVACLVCVPEIKYSWLIAEDPPSIAWVTRFENWLAEVLPDVRAVRLDELLRQDWEAVAGSWNQSADPVGEVGRWLALQQIGSAYFRLFPIEARDAAAARNPRRP